MSIIYETEHLACI